MNSVVGSRAALAIALMAAASVALTLGFACALPLAAFAALSAVYFGVGAGVAAVVAVWLTNQCVGFGYMHYSLDATTLAWGGALGALGLVALFAARAVLGLVGGLAGAVLAFLVAFVAYEGLLFALDVGLGLDPAVFLAPVVTRIFAINAAAFGALGAASLLLARIRPAGVAALRRA